MIEVNGINCFLALKDSRFKTAALNNYNTFIEDNPDQPAIYGHLTEDGHIETIQANNTIVSEIKIAW